MLSIRVLIVLLAITFVAAFPSPSDQIIFRDDDDEDGGIIENALKLEDDDELLPTSEVKSTGTESRSGFDSEDDSENESFSENEPVDPALMKGKLFQGDMEMDEDIIDLALSNSSIESRTGVISQLQRWPKNKYGAVVVPTLFWKGSYYSQSQKNVMISGMNTIERYTCIRFVKRTNERDFILIHSGNGCSSHVGKNKNGGQQNLSLSKKGCMTSATVMHELIHALGYDHMQNHVDRDNYVEIRWNNIEPAERHNFEKVNPRMFSNFGTAYDMHSIMHYGKTAFSLFKNRNTMVPRNRLFWNILGQRHSLSRGDVARINNMYKCFK